MCHKHHQAKSCLAAACAFNAITAAFAQKFKKYLSIVLKLVKQNTTDKNWPCWSRWLEETKNNNLSAEKTRLRELWQIFSKHSAIAKKVIFLSIYPIRLRNSYGLFDNGQMKFHGKIAGQLRGTNLWGPNRTSLMDSKLFDSLHSLEHWMAFCVEYLCCSVLLLWHIVHSFWLIFLENVDPSKASITIFLYSLTVSSIPFNPIFDHEYIWQ